MILNVQEKRIVEKMNARVDVVESKLYFLMSKDAQKKARAEAYTIPLDAWGAKDGHD